MGQAARRTGLSPAEYLAFERASEQKHEYASGELFAMSCCSREHSLLAGNIQRELGNALLDRACEVHTWRCRSRPLRANELSGGR
ncbi:Uma2 family endonuclease [Sorangium sp. So ce315]|uniref:Uma2 family endonuclease n=1 Tax=Sorangium sp. So ce315 TaxID=3133299 RepID=UPI003F60A952